MRHLGKIGFGVLVSLVAATGSASAGSAAVAARCSNSTVNGAYGFTVRGVDEPSGNPVATVGLFTADGSGNIGFGKITESDDGTVTTATISGTYSIAANCTGTLATTDSNSLVRHYFVSLSGVKLAALDLVGTDPGLTVSGSARPQGVGVCGLTGKVEGFAEHVTGYVGTVPEDAVGRIGTDGNGNITFGVEALSAGGKIYNPDHVAGSYTANSDCTGTAQVTYRNTTSNFNYVTVDAGKQYLVIETDPGTTIAGTLARQ